ncbi:MAG: hypothetical protein AB1563_04600 [Bacillota bacterium]
MNGRFIEVMKYARIPLALNAQKGDNIVIVVDTRTDPIVWQAMAAAANEMGMEVTVAMMTPRPAHGYNPTEPIMAAMRDPSTKLCIYLTTTALAHAKISEELGALGKGFILMEEATAEMLSGGPAAADYEAMNALGEKLRDIFTRGSEIRVTSKLGTDLVASIQGRPGFLAAGKLSKHPASGILGCAFPDGEVNVCPVEGTGQGIIVFDTTAHSVGLLKSPIKLTVKDGWVTNIEGGAEAEVWKRILADHGDTNSYNCPAEIAVGLNPNVTITGVMRTDKKKYGATHIGMGDTIVLGGTCKAKLRLEGVIKEPTISVDGQVVVDGGRILVG